MKPKPPKQHVRSPQIQSTGFHFHIALLNNSKSQTFLKSAGRLFHITGPKSVIKFSP